MDSSDSDDDYQPDLKEIENLSEEDSENDLNDDNEDNKPRGKKRNKKSDENSSAKRLKQNDELLEKNDEDEKKHADKLWADFLGDDADKVNEDEKKTNQTKEIEIKAPEKKIIKETYDFVGEKIEVTKEIIEPNPENTKIPEIKSTTKTLNNKLPFPNRPRSSGGGLSNILSQIGKNKKISTLEKSKLDWDGFKRSEGIEEEIQTFNKGKQGYLDRQDFLERTDLKQFDIEKSLRQSSRSSNR